jgi:tRNA 2-thiouridine synthesizing protein A
MTYDMDLDASGLLCPLPVLKARKRLLGMKNGQVLRLITTDPAAVIDVPHFCTEAGHDLLDQSKDDARMIFMIKRSS